MKAEAVKQLAFPFEQFEEEIFSPLLGHKLTDAEAFVASLLLDASSEKPIQIKQIIGASADVLGKPMSDRHVKDMIRSLRRNHAFPILSRKGSPSGYWWCSSTAEMKEFARLWQSQYFDEMRTLSVIIKHNYPRLAGQLSFRDLEK